jgi:hypothetical protein
MSKKCVLRLTKIVIRAMNRFKLKNEKVFGYALLILGIILLLFSICEMINVYYGNSPPPKLFDLQDVSLPVGQSGTGVSLIQGSQISQIANLFFWFILMVFILFAGGKIASLGATMIKDIQVEIKESTSVPKEASC